MENNNKFTDVSYSDLKDDIYYTAVQVAEILNLPVTTIRGWNRDDNFGDLLGIQRENGRRKYTKKDIENLSFIKELVDKKYSYTQIREIISKKGFGFGEYDGGLIDPNDPLGFEALAIRITQRQNEQLEVMKKSLFNDLKKFIEVYSEIQNLKLNNALDEFNESLDSKLEKQEEKIKNIFDEMELSQRTRDAELIDKLHKTLEDRKKESEKKKSWFSNIFK